MMSLIVAQYNVQINMESAGTAEFWVCIPSGICAYNRRPPDSKRPPHSKSDLLIHSCNKKPQADDSIAVLR